MSAALAPLGKRRARERDMSKGARIRRMLERVYARRIREAIYQGDEATDVMVCFLDHKEQRATRLLFKFRRAR